MYHSPLTLTLMQIIVDRNTRLSAARHGGFRDVTVADPGFPGACQPPGGVITYYLA